MWILFNCNKMSRDDTFFRIVKMVPCNMFSDGVWIFYKASVHYMSNLSHWDVTENCTHVFIQSAKVFKMPMYEMPILIFPFQIRFMVQNIARHSKFHCQLNWLKGNLWTKNRIAGFLPCYTCHIILHYKTF